MILINPNSILYLPRHEDDLHNIEIHNILNPSVATALLADMIFPPTSDWYDQNNENLLHKIPMQNSYLDLKTIISQCHFIFKQKLKCISNY